MYRLIQNYVNYLIWWWWWDMNTRPKSRNKQELFNIFKTIITLQRDSKSWYFYRFAH